MDFRFGSPRQWIVRIVPPLIVGVVVLAEVVATALPGAAAQSISTTTTIPYITQLQINDLNTRVDDLRSTLNVLIVLAGVLFTLIAGGGVYGLVASIRSERRAEGRAMEGHALGILGETAAQGRADSAERRAEESYNTSRDSSQKTVQLVNDTLELARQATERAASTLRHKAEADLEELNAIAHNVLGAVLLGDDFKAIVEKIKVRGPLNDLAGEIATREGYIRSQDLDLSPECLFVKGMGKHLNQQSRAAITSLSDAVRLAPEHGDLSVFAQFWTGYEHNNVDAPETAVLTFKRALQSVAVDSPRYFELRRIALESEFFQLARSQSIPSDVRQQVRLLDTELDRLQESTRIHPIGLEGATASIALLRGNIWLWAARFTGEPPEDRERMLSDADIHYQESDATHSSLWSRFGSLEVRFDREDTVDAAGYRLIESDALRRLANRREPRSMALLAETRFISMCRRQATPGELVNVHSEALGKLEAVDEGITLYSQIRKHNVSWPEFANELEELRQEYVQEI